MCIYTIRVAYMYDYSSILFRCIYLFTAAFPPFFKPSIVPVISLEYVYSPAHRFLKIGYYVALEDFFTFFQEMYSNYSLCQLTPRIKAFKSLCVITIMCRNNLGHH